MNKKVGGVIAGYIVGLALYIAEHRYDSDKVVTMLPAIIVVSILAFGLCLAFWGNAEEEENRDNAKK